MVETPNGFLRQFSLPYEPIVNVLNTSLMLYIYRVGFLLARTEAGLG